MNKRKILKYKICKRYEEDIWGIFFRKQQRRDFLLKNLGFTIFKTYNNQLLYKYYKDKSSINIVKNNLNEIRSLLFSKYLDSNELKQTKNSKNNIFLKNITYLRAEYFLSYFFGIKVRQKFFRMRMQKELTQGVNEFNNLNKVIFRKFKFKTKKRKARIYTIQQKLLKNNNIRRKSFTLDILPKNKIKRSNQNYKSVYFHRTLKVWMFRKFYGCLTNKQLKNLCLISYRKRGDIISNFIILLESRLDTVLYRAGIVSSIFEARQLISHKKVLINNNIINIRSYNLNSSDILSLDSKVFNNVKSNMVNRIYNKSILFYNINYIEVNYKLLNMLFIPKLLKISEVPYNFELTDKDINNILYYYY